MVKTYERINLENRLGNAIDRHTRASYMLNEVQGRCTDSRNKFNDLKQQNEYTR